MEPAPSPSWRTAHPFRKRPAPHLTASVWVDPATGFELSAVAARLGPTFIVREGTPDSRDTATGTAIAIVGHRSGDEIEHMRRDHPRLLLVMVTRTAIASPADLVTSLRAGADFVMVDPSPVELAARVRVLIRRRLLTLAATTKACDR